jgi:hypothetical protein
MFWYLPWKRPVAEKRFRRLKVLPRLSRHAMMDSGLALLLNHIIIACATLTASVSIGACYNRIETIRRSASASCQAC